MNNILVVGAHYDDAELGVGGTAAKFVEEGKNVYKLTLTDNVTKSSHLHINVDYETSLNNSMGEVDVKVVCKDGKSVVLQRVQEEGMAEMWARDYFGYDTLENA